jgi:hypothetical protein
MSNNIKDIISIDDVLYQFSLSQETPTAELLEKFTQRYPEYAESLTVYAINWAKDILVTSDTVTDKSESSDDIAVSIAMSRFLNKRHELKAVAAKSSELVNVIYNPFGVLDKNEFRKLAQQLNITRLFLSKIRDRIIEASTVPEGFFDFLSNNIDESPRIIKVHFYGEAQLQTNMKFKSKGKPSAQNKQSYEEAIETSSLSSDQKSILRNI